MYLTIMTQGEQMLSVSSAENLQWIGVRTRLGVKSSFPFFKNKQA